MTEPEISLRAILEALPHFVWAADASGKPTYVDPRLLAWLSADSAANALEGWFARVHPDDRAVAEEVWRRAVSAGEELRIAHRLRRHDGHYVWFETRGRPLFDEDGAVRGWVGTVDDISSEAETRRALEAEQIRLAKMAAASPQMLYSFRRDPLGHATFPYVSPAFTKLFQLDAEELTRDGASFFRLGNPADVPALTASVAESARTLTLWRHEWRVNAPDVGEIWLEAHSMPVRDPDGSTTWHGTVSDITHRRRTEAEIRELNQNLEQRVAQRTEELELANRELESFSYSVSHDLREPLRAVNGFAQALLEDFGPGLPDDARHFAQNIRQGALRMGRLIDDLLAFSRLTRQPLVRRTVNVRRLVEGCIKTLTPVGSPAKVTLGELVDCEADPGLLEQVFTNLVSNAFKYSRKRDLPEIGVESQRDAAGRVVYAVRDNGTGFDMKYAGKLFNVFQRLHRASEFEGTGVGLAIVNRIVTRHGGRVWVQAAPDQGATFFFTLAGGHEPPPV